MLKFQITKKINLYLIIFLALFVFGSQYYDHKQTDDIKETIDSIKTEFKNFNDKINKKDSLIFDGLDSLDSLLRDVNSITAEYKQKKPFYNAVGKTESNGNYLEVNDFGFLGKYQFSIKTVRGLGIDVTEEEFLNNPILQERAMQKYIASNKWSLRKYIKKYKNTIITYTNKEGELQQFRVTASGIVAAAHLAGAGGVKSYFDSKGLYIPTDAYGATVILYMERFSGYAI